MSQFPDSPSVTQRFDPLAGADVVTQFYAAAAPIPVVPNSGFLPPGLIIATAYRILAGPLGGQTGEAEVYQCHDEHRDTAVAVKLYRHQHAPKAEVLAQLQGLAHPNLVSLHSHGVWQGRFYEVMEYCAGGVMAEHMPLDEAMLRAYLPALNQGLHYCHSQGIVHRDIKPNNLFFRDIERQQPLLGDFGISSFQDGAAPGVRVTRTAGHLTLDYAAPELLDGHEVGPPTDYYALGITLLHLLQGQSPYQGMTQNDILVAHLRGRLPLPDHLSDDYRLLLRGLTLHNPQQRWGYAELQAWLRGAAPALPITVPRADEGCKPYPGYPQVNSLPALAAALDQFDAAQQLLRGDIRRWVFDHIDQDLANRIEALEQAYQEQPALGLIRLRYLLDPQAALLLNNQRTVASLAELAALLVSAETPAGHPLRQVLEAALWQGAITSWLAAGQHAGARTAELLDKIASLCQRLQFTKYQGSALFALLYTLDPQRPLQFLPDCDIRHPGEFENGFRHNRRAAATTLHHLLSSKRLEEWVRAAQFPDWETTCAFIEEVRSRYLDQPKLGIYTLRWYFCPSLPFPFEGQRITQPAALARLIDASPDSRARGLALLQAGWIRAWLVGARKVSSATDLDHALLMVDALWPEKLEAVLHLLDPSLAWPTLSVTPPLLNLGAVTADEPRSRRLRLSNSGRGFLSGEITLEHDGQGITLNQYLITGDTEIEVTAEALGHKPGLHVQNTLFIHSNGGDCAVPIQFRIRNQVQRETWLGKIQRWLGA